MKRRIGAHQSIVGGYEKAVERVVDIGGNCLQVFSASPRMWQNAGATEKEIDVFIKLCVELDVSPVYFHASYLINLADDGAVGEKSVKSLVAELTFASRLGVRGSVVHLGSTKDGSEEPVYKHKKYGTLLKNIRAVIKKIPSDVAFIIENAGTRKIGKSIDEIAHIIADLDDERIHVCLDTCHLHAVGIDISDGKKLNKFLGEFDKNIGLGRLELWHVNDSKDEFGSFRDRHENISEGTINIEVFRGILNNPKTRDLPFILEIPGFDGSGPDRKNIEVLKQLVS